MSSSDADTLARSSFLSEACRGLIWTACIGLIVGALAKFIMPGKDPGGLLITMVIGIAGAFVAGFLGRILGMYQPGEGAGLIASVIGAMLLLWAYRKFGSKTTA